MTAHELAQDLGLDVKTVRSWIRRGVLVSSLGEHEVEIARVLAKLPNGASTITLRRVAGVLRNAQEQAHTWEGLAIAWPIDAVAGMRVLPLSVLPHPRTPDEAELGIVRLEAVEQ